MVCYHATFLLQLIIEKINVLNVLAKNSDLFYFIKANAKSHFKLSILLLSNKNISVKYFMP